MVEARQGGSELDFADAEQQALAADGAIACFSSNLFPLSLNAYRAAEAFDPTWIRETPFSLLRFTRENVKWLAATTHTY
jgi:hypothetical protein